MRTPPKKKNNRLLTPKQQAFVREYLVDLNQMAAAERAGYSRETAQSAAHEIIRIPRVAEAIQKAMDERARSVKVSAYYVLTTIRETIERCKQAEPVREFNRETGEYEETGVFKFDPGAVLKGCELLGKHLKLFSDRVEHSGPDGGEIPLRIKVEFVAPKAES